MTIGEISNLIGLILVSSGLVATWIRNGRSTAEKYGALVKEVSDTNKKLDSHNSKLDKIQESVNAQQVACARISSGILARVDSAEQNIKDIKCN